MLETSLDVRTLMRMQSLLLSHIKVNYEPRHYSMLKLQKHARTIIETESNESDSEGRSVIYGDDSDPIERKALQSYIKEHDKINECSEVEVLSPRTLNLQAGMFPKSKNRQKSSL